MKKIESKDDIKLFKNEIKNQLKDALSNVEGNLDGNFSFEMWNSDDTSVCHISTIQDLDLPDFDIYSSYCPIVITNFMFGNGFNLNKHTTDYQLNKVVKRIINKYNELFDKEIEEYGE